MTSNAKAHRRSLKECLKTILQRRRDDHQDDHLTVGSGILKRKDPSLALLPAFRSLTTLPDFDSSRYDIDQYSISITDQSNGVVPRTANYSQRTILPSERSTSSLSQREIQDAYHYQSQLGRLAQSCSIERDWYSNENASSYLKDSVSGRDLTKAHEFASRESFLSDVPERSFDQLINSEFVHFQSPLSQLAHACNVPSIYRHGASLQASLATLQSGVRSASTLRLQRSTQDLKPNRASAPAPYPMRHASFSPPREPAPVCDPGKEVPSQQAFSSKVILVAEPARVASSRSVRSGRASELEDGLSSINHFSSFCVLDAATPGCPVTATSGDLRFVFDIGEEFCLNTVGVDGASMETVTGQDEDGNVRIHLVIYSPLVNPNSGRSRFVLASLLDITSFITDAASVPDLETISEESIVEEEPKTPTRIHLQQSPKYELAADKLFESCFLPEHRLQTPIQAQKDDIWLDIATEETRKSRSLKSAPGTPRSTSSARSSARSMDDVLDQFLASLQELYSEFFLLGKSPLDENSYEICNVSPKVHALREYMEGHLTKTSLEDKAHLEQQLTQDKSFQMNVRWGVMGNLKQLYCVPLFGRSNITWICFLVEDGRWTGLPLWE
ncbi:hypothetical protein OHC33_006433 [Knufia fluminis]|uniref:Uncharacterized protein n=1 Tax=Knufia fluminis TaxID=191047 RepID=A0AAN8EEN3_9EURO|nr:hypothetical protein OHC33_006433 [Knufia fluminis]